jgi:hypothetical protein
MNLANHILLFPMDDSATFERERDNLVNEIAQASSIRVVTVE